MNEIWQFILDNWRIILSVIVVIVEAIMAALIAKKNKTSAFQAIVSTVQEKLPELISEVECAGNGSEKKNRVIAECLKATAQKLGRALTADETTSLTVKYGEQIESILTTPTKKKESEVKKSVYRAS